MSKILFLVLLAFIVAALGIVALQIIRALGRMLRVLLVSASVALIAGLVAGLAAQIVGFEEPGNLSVFIAAIALISALAFTLREGPPVTKKAINAEGRQSHVTPANSQKRVEGQPVPKLGPQAPSVPPEPKGDEQVSEAWNAAYLLLPDEITNLSGARESCARLLHRMSEDGSNWDGDWIEGATFIRHHIPLLVAQTQRACDGAEPPENNEMRRKLLSSLEAIGRRAQDLLAHERNAAKEEVDRRHSHIADRLGKGP